MKTKIISLILAVCFIFSAIPAFSASAETKAAEIFQVELKAISTTAPSLNTIGPGEEVTIKVTIKQNTGVAWMRMKISYDLNAFECVDTKSYKLFGASEDVKIGYDEETGEKYVQLQVLPITTNLKNTGDSFEFVLKTKEGYCGNANISAVLCDNDEYQCTDKTFLNPVPFVGHTITLPIHNSVADKAIVTPPTCTKNGYTTHTCTCGKTYVGNYTKTGPHTDADKNFICDVCKNSFFLEGDINGDYAVDVVDIVRMKNILAGNTTSSGASADIDYNLRVNALDLLLLRKYIIGAIDNLYQF